VRTEGYVYGGVSYGSCVVCVWTHELILCVPVCVYMDVYVCVFAVMIRMGIQLMESIR